MVHQHFDAVWRSLCRLGVPNAAADDAAQRVFMIAVGKLATIRPEGERSYLLGIAFRVASDARRTLKRRREVPEERPKTALTPNLLRKSSWTASARGNCSIALIRCRWTSRGFYDVRNRGDVIARSGECVGHPSRNGRFAGEESARAFSKGTSTLGLRPGTGFRGRNSWLM